MTREVPPEGADLDLNDASELEDEETVSRPYLPLRGVLGGLTVLAALIGIAIVQGDGPGVTGGIMAGLVFVGIVLLIGFGRNG